MAVIVAHQSRGVQPFRWPRGVALQAVVGAGKCSMTPRRPPAEDRRRDKVAVREPNWGLRFGLGAGLPTLWMGRLNGFPGQCVAPGVGFSGLPSPRPSPRGRGGLSGQPIAIHPEHPRFTASPLGHHYGWCDTSHTPVPGYGLLTLRQPWPRKSAKDSCLSAETWYTSPLP